MFLVFYHRGNLKYCVTSVRIQSFSGQYFPTFRLNTDQKNSEYRHFSHSGTVLLSRGVFKTMPNI